MARINLDEIDFKKMSFTERLIWFLKNFNKVGYYEPYINSTVIEEKALRTIFNLDYKKYLDGTDLYQWFDPVFAEIVNDRDFFRKYPDIRDHYKVRYYFDMEEPRLCLEDFTDDFVKLYLEHRYGIKDPSKEKDSRDEYYRVGKFEYKNNNLFFDNEKIKLSPQELLMMRKFMSDQISGTKYYHYDDICDIVSTKGPTSKSNIQKLISKIRRAINKKTKDFIIESKSSDGYTFVIKNIR